MKEKKSVDVEETVEYVLFECCRYERFRSDWKGVLLQERESGLENILGYKGASEMLEQVTFSVLGGMWKYMELREREREPR